MLKALIQRFFIAKRRQSKVSGFTLIELLVSIIIASIIVGTLLGFLVNILERDRTEQAKAESQEEIQAALNFIADDMTEAVYIYDSDGLYQNGTDGLNVFSQLPHNFNTGNGCNAANCTPVVVFWKIFRYDRDDLVKGGNSTTPNRAVRCLDEPAQQALSCTGGNKYTYSLVAYYLLKDNNTNWSSASRIVRWELKDGLKWSCQDTSTAAQTNAALCPIAANQRITVNSVDYAVAPDPGFRRFNLGNAQAIDTATVKVSALSVAMRAWRADTANYNLAINPFDELVDFVDDTPYSATQDDITFGNSPAGERVEINVTPNILGSATVTTVPFVPSTNTACDNPNVGVGVGLTVAQLGTAAQRVFSQRIPPDFANATANPIGLSSFYTCVNANQISARVFIRSNSLARLQDNIANRPVSDATFESFLPTANVRVFGRGILSVDP